MTVLTALKSLFTPLPEGSIRYKGFVIAANPEEDGGRFRIRGNISKKDREHSFTLVDRVAAREDCVKLVHRKAKVIIDQKGEGLFA